MKDADDARLAGCTTGRLAHAAGCSVQQVRDLERLGVIPPARRLANGYRRFSTVHLTALRAYRRLAVSVGPVVARATMRDIRQLPHDAAVARVVALHVDLARSREQALLALRALDGIVDESAREAPAAPGDSMSITELSAALGVRASTLRFWEQEGLITPERPVERGPRRYPPSAVRDARVVTALRAGGYRVPAVQAVMASVTSVGDTKDARDALHGRLRTIAASSEALLQAGADIAELLRPSAVDGPPPARQRMEAFGRAVRGADATYWAELSSWGVTHDGLGSDDPSTTGPV